METLFSFELVVDNIRLVEEAAVVSELAVALRLLDFPTLLIYQPEHKERHGEGDVYTFNRGKACFFKMNMDSLHSHLSHTPLYAMVLDVKEEMPKLCGNACISLAKVMGRIKRDANERGVSVSSSHGQRGTIDVSNLKGERVGTMSLSYKLLSLGSSLLSHVNDNTHSHSTDEVGLKESNDKKKTDTLCKDSECVQQSNLDEGSKPPKESQAIQEAVTSKNQETDSFGEEDMSVFCPPHLYYNNSAEERRQYEEVGRKQLKSNHIFPFEDAVGQVQLKEEIHNAANSVEEKQQISSDVTPNVIGQALQQMPLLNALLVELSQLNSPNVSQPLNVHPNLAWIYRPAEPTETAAVENTSQKNQHGSKIKQVASPKLKESYSQRRCSTPIQTDRKNTPRKKLVYGTTKSFNLRIKQNSPVSGKQRECVDLIKGKVLPNKSSEQTKVIKKVPKSAIRSTKSSKLSENIEYMFQNIATESLTQDGVVKKQLNVDTGEPTGNPPEDESFAEKPLLIESPARLMHSPTDIEGDDSVLLNKSSPDSYVGKVSGSVCSSVDSSGSGHSRGMDDYADDFNSYEQSDAVSLSPSPESLKPKTPKYYSDWGRSSDSSPETVKKSTNSRPVIPVPIKASRSPQRALRGTYTIQRHTFGVSFSSEDGDRGGTSSKPLAYAVKQISHSSKEDSFSRESLQSPETHRSVSEKNKKSVTNKSGESSFDLKTEEEDELGTLDLRKGYKNISELVAHKLPGYTM